MLDDVPQSIRRVLGLRSQQARHHDEEEQVPCVKTKRQKRGEEQAPDVIPVPDDVDQPPAPQEDREEVRVPRAPPASARVRPQPEPQDEIPVPPPQRPAEAPQQEDEQETVPVLREDHNQTRRRTPAPDPEPPEEVPTIPSGPVRRRIRGKQPRPDPYQRNTSQRPSEPSDPMTPPPEPPPPPDPPDAATPEDQERAPQYEPETLYLDGGRRWALQDYGCLRL